MQTHFFLANRRQQLAVARQTGSSFFRVASIVRFRKIAKAFGSIAQQWVQHWREFGTLLALATTVYWLAGCTRAPATAALAATPSPISVPAFAALPAEDALPALVLAERNAARSGDLPLLAVLWAEDARIIDGRGTLESGDDYLWQGRSALLDRYAIAVFPAPPPALEEPLTLEITVHGDTARAILGTDHWSFVRHGGRWWLLELAY